MSYVQKSLLDGERVLYNGKLHWRIYMPSIFYFIIACIFLYVSRQNHQFLAFGAIIMCAAFVLFLKELIVRASTELAVTNQRIIFKRGLISRSTMELNHNKIESIREEQGIIGRIFGYGSLVIEGTGGGKEYLINIDSPLAFKKQAQAAINAASGNVR